MTRVTTGGRNRPRRQLRIGRPKAGSETVTSGILSKGLTA
ncbi:hypothetical protein BSSX_p0083 (plasmid) [Bacillus subtilis]|nr:hypothetical protein BSSX_p0083 [Bacillus subtilis]